MARSVITHVAEDALALWETTPGATLFVQKGRALYCVGDIPRAYRGLCWQETCPEALAQTIAEDPDARRL